MTILIILIIIMIIWMLCATILCRIMLKTIKNISVLVNLHSQAISQLIQDTAILRGEDTYES